MKVAKKYTIEFKEEAIKLVTEKGYTQSEAGNSLGVPAKNISRWIKELGGGRASDRKKLSADQEEIKRLKRENERLRMEREILKKAAAFFASEKA